jgi:hypothetical protein
MPVSTAVQYFLEIEILGFFFPADHFESTVDIIESLRMVSIHRRMAHIKMPGEIPVMNGLHELF